MSHIQNKLALCLALLSLFVFALASCTGENHANTDGGNAGAKNAPKRIVSLAPSVTETLFLLGLDKEIVGVSSYCNYPPAALERPRLGGLYDPNLESIIALKPDLVILFPSLSETIGASLRAMGIKTLANENQTLEDIEQSFITIGNAVGHVKKGRELAEQFRTEIERARKKYAGRETSAKVMVVVGRNPGTMQSIYVAGKKTFYNEILEIIGASNIFGDVDMNYPQPSIEEIITRNPDIIIEAASGRAGEKDLTRNIKNEWARLGNISAVANDRIYVFVDQYVSIPGPRITLLLHDFEEAVYGDEHDATDEETSGTSALRDH